MFRKGSWLVAALALLAVAPVANAAGGWTISLNGGLGIPTGDFKDSLEAKSGPQFALDICYHLSDLFAVGVDGGMNQNKHGFEGDVEDLGGGATLTADKDKFIAWHAGVHGKYMIPMQGKVHPYGVLGVGIYNLKEDYEYTFNDGAGTIVTFTDEADEAAGNFEQPGSRLGGRIGLGAMYQATGQVGVGIEADYNMITMDKDKFDVSSLQYLTVRAVVSYNLMAMGQ